MGELGPQGGAPTPLGMYPDTPITDTLENVSVDVPMISRLHLFYLLGDDISCMRRLAAVLLARFRMNRLADFGVASPL